MDANISIKTIKFLSKKGSKNHEKRTLLLTTTMVMSILALTACKVAEKTSEGEDTGVTDMGNQIYVPLDTDGDGAEDQAIVIISANGGNNNTPEMEDIKGQIENSGIPQWETFRENPEDESGSFCGVLNNGLGRVTAGNADTFSVFFINFEEGNEWGYEPGYRAVYASNDKPAGSIGIDNYALNDYVWFSDSAAALFEEYGDDFNRDDYNNLAVYRPIKDYYGFLPAE